MKVSRVKTTQRNENVLSQVSALETLAHTTCLALRLHLNKACLFSLNAIALFIFVCEETQRGKPEYKHNLLLFVTMLLQTHTHTHAQAFHSTHHTSCFAVPARSWN